MIRGEEPAEFWGGMYYAMHRYMQTRRLKPLGPHRQLADELLDKLRERCRACNGWGVLRQKAGGARDCPHCEGGGGVWTCSGEELAAAYCQIEEAFPGSTLKWFITPPLLWPDRPYQYLEEGEEGPSLRAG